MDKLPKKTIIHSAELILPVQQLFGSPYKNSFQVTAATTEHVDSTTLFGLNLGAYSEFTTGYTINIRNHIQEIVSGNRENLGIIVSPTQFITSAERIIFNGSNTDNKLFPKLSIVYTEF